MKWEQKSWEGRKTQRRQSNISFQYNSVVNPLLLCFLCLPHFPFIQDSRVADRCNEFLQCNSVFGEGSHGLKNRQNSIKERGQKRYHRRLWKMKNTGARLSTALPLSGQIVLQSSSRDSSLKNHLQYILSNLYDILFIHGTKKLPCPRW